MASHNDTGKEAEQMAADWLEQRGYEILHRNWRYTKYEIDIVARKNGFLHFVEVKARKTAAFGHPEESVTKRKFKNLQKAADQYLFMHPGHRWIQYDIVAITLGKNGEPDFFLIEDLYL